MRRAHPKQDLVLGRLGPWGLATVGLATVALCWAVACGGDSGLYSGKQGDPCDSVLDCGEGLECDPVTRICRLTGIGWATIEPIRVSLSG